MSQFPDSDDEDSTRPSTDPKVEDVTEKLEETSVSTKEKQEEPPKEEEKPKQEEKQQEEAQATQKEKAQPATKQQQPYDANIQHAVEEVKSKLVDIGNVDLDVEQADTSSPLYAAILFEDVGKQPDTLPINPKVLEAAYEMGYKKPSKIQATALPLLLKNKDRKMENMIFQSQAGTGKTAAFAMNVLTRCDPRIKSCQALYIAPTFHLMYQTHHVFNALGSKTDLSVGVLFGVGRRNEQGEVEDVASVKNLALSTRECDDQIICATLDKILNVAKHNGSIRVGRKHVTLFNPNAVEILVIDEADEFLQNHDNFAKLEELKSRLTGLKQVILLSATFKDSTIEFGKRIALNPNVIKLPISEVVKENVQQYYMTTPSMDHKLDCLLSMYNTLTVEQCIVFCNERQTAHELAGFFHDAGHGACVLVGGRDMTKMEQLSQLDVFIKKEAKILITTNILARGIDIEQMSLVVNFDMPVRPNDETGVYEADPETYVHRIGRCGRFGHKGTAVTFVESEWDFKVLTEIQNFFKMRVKEIETHLQLAREVNKERKPKDKRKKGIQRNKTE
eukprot:m.18247 g.18247  ORF g.18247 m.18247 type:complete len:562 (-) comp8280_c0_seq1:167-1852(-)